MEAIDTTTGYVMQQGSKERQTVSVTELAQLLAHGWLFAAQPRRQERTDGRQRTGACQDHAQAPQGQDGGLGFTQVGQVRLDGLRPFGDTGVARHTFPPRMYGIYGYPYNT